MAGAFDKAWSVLKQERTMRTPDEESMIREMFRHVMGHEAEEEMHLTGGNSNHMLSDMYERINNDEEAHGRFSSFIEGNPMHRSGAEVNWDAVLNTLMKPHQDPPEAVARDAQLRQGDEGVGFPIDERVSLPNLYGHNY